MKISHSCTHFCRIPSARYRQSTARLSLYPTCISRTPLLPFCAVPQLRGRSLLGRDRTRHDTRPGLGRQTYHGWCELANVPDRSHCPSNPENIPILPALNKPRIQVCADYPLIQLGTSNVLEAVQRVLVRVILDKAESAGRFGVSVKAHHESLYFSTSEQVSNCLTFFLFGCIFAHFANSSWICSSVV